MSNSNSNRNKNKNNKNKEKSVCVSTCDTLDDYVVQPIDDWVVQPAGGLWDRFSTIIVLVVFVALLFYWFGNDTPRSVGETLEGAIEGVGEGVSSLGRSITGAFGPQETLSAQIGPNELATGAPAPTASEIRALFNF